MKRDGSTYGREYLVSAMRFLAFLCDTEHYQTHVDSYFPVTSLLYSVAQTNHQRFRSRDMQDDDAKREFVSLQDSVVGPLIAEKAVERRHIRPLMDSILRLKRNLSS